MPNLRPRSFLTPSLLPVALLAACATSPTAAEPEFRPFLVPGTFDGWWSLKGRWAWEGDTLVSQKVSAKPSGSLGPNKVLRDFEMKLDFRGDARWIISGTANEPRPANGFWLTFAAGKVSVASMAMPEIADGETMEESPMSGGKSTYQPNGWTTVRVLSIGDETSISIGDQVVHRWRDVQPHDAWRLAFWCDPDGRVELRDIGLRDSLAAAVHATR